MHSHPDTAWQIEFVPIWQFINLHFHFVSSLSLDHAAAKIKSRPGAVSTWRKCVTLIVDSKRIYIYIYKWYGFAVAEGSAGLCVSQKKVRLIDDPIQRLLTQLHKIIYITQVQ